MGELLACALFVFVAAIFFLSIYDFVLAYTIAGWCMFGFVLLMLWIGAYDWFSDWRKQRQRLRARAPKGAPTPRP